METLKKFSQFVQKRANEKAANEKAETIQRLGEQAYLKLMEADIKSDSDFKDYAFAVLKKAHGSDFDETKAQEVVDGLLSKKDGDDYGALVGMLTSSLGESVEEGYDYKINSKQENPNPQGYPPPSGTSTEVPAPEEEEEDEEIATAEIQAESTVNEDEDEDEDEGDVEDEDEKEKEDHYKGAEEDDEDQIKSLEKDKEYDEEEAEKEEDDDSEADTEDEEDEEVEEAISTTGIDIPLISGDESKKIEKQIVDMGTPKTLGDSGQFITKDQDITSTVKGEASQSGEGGAAEMSVKGGDSSEEIEAKIVAMGTPKSKEGDGKDLITKDQNISSGVKSLPSEAGTGGDPEMPVKGGNSSEEIEDKIMAMGTPKSVQGLAGKFVGENRFIMSFDRFVNESKNS